MASRLRKFFNFFLLLLIFAFLFWQKDKIITNFNFLLSGPCDQPISYHLGEIDKGYGLTKEQFLADIGEAGQIWSSVVGKNLFRFEENGQIVVNLIYSDRQSMADNLSKLESDLKNNKASLDSLKADYESAAADFEKRLIAFNQQMEVANKQGHISKEEYDNLKSQQASLQDEAEKLMDLGNQLDLNVKQYNSQVGQFNQGVSQFKTAVTAKPEAGLYDGSVPKIDIYLTASDQELIHTLAHEMGHALGLAHTSDPNSVMYPYTNEVIKPDSQESGDLKAYCGQTNFGLLGETFVNKIENLYNSRGSL